MHKGKHGDLDVHVRQGGKRRHAAPPHSNRGSVRLFTAVQPQAAYVVDNHPHGGEACKKRGGALQLRRVGLQVKRQAMLCQQREPAQVVILSGGWSGSTERRETMAATLVGTYPSRNAGTPPVR